MPRERQTAPSRRRPARVWFAPSRGDGTADIVVSAFGDPFDPATWSGTPCRICRALAARGLNVAGVGWSQAHAGRTLGGGRLRAIARRLGASTSSGAPYRERRERERRLAAAWTARAAEAAGCSTVLHLSTLDMPVVPGDGTDHYVLCDATCQGIQESSNPKLTIQLGCPTVEIK